MQLMLPLAFSFGHFSSQEVSVTPRKETVISTYIMATHPYCQNITARLISTGSLFSELSRNTKFFLVQHVDQTQDK